MGLRLDTVVPVPALGVTSTLILELALGTTGIAALRRRHAERRREAVPPRRSRAPTL